MINDKLNLTISTLNVNSLNVSTLGGKVSKTFVKIEGATGKKADILFLCDCRMGRKGKEIEKMFNLSRNGKYKLYYNSDKESRGVAIAIKASIFHVVNNIYKDDDGNLLMLQIKIQDMDLNLACIYGPNSNDVEFFRQMRTLCENSGLKTIIGGDFNTVLDNRAGEVSIDRVGDGFCPNVQNSRVINEWIEEGEIADPFRILYPEKAEFSYTSFRREGNTGKNRLDFFLVSRELIRLIRNVRYEDRLGRDFDHKEVTLTLGGQNKTSKEQIFKDTINKERAKYVGAIAFYDIINEHLRTPDEELRVTVGIAEQKLREIEILKIRENYDELPGKIAELTAVKELFPNAEEIIEREKTCNNRTLYEVHIMAIKNRLIGIQINKQKTESKIREELNEQLKMYKLLDGINSKGWKRINEEILVLNDNDLKRRAGK